MAETTPVLAHTFSNGLTVLLREDRSAPLVSFWTWYRVGSRNERPGRTGISHWVEHMQFKGTPSLGKGQIFRDVSRHGGTLNALTSHDWTAYFETLPSSELDLSLRIESDRMVNSLFDPEETESERTVILSERQGAENNPGYLLYEEIAGAAFRAHPYRHMVIGYEPDLRSISRDDLYGHYRRYYHPANAFVVGVGAFDRGDVVRRIEDAFGGIAAGEPAAAVDVQEPEQRAERRVLMRRPAPTGYLQMAFHTPGARHPDTMPLLIADAVLSGGKGMGLGGGGPMGRSSRLYRSLVDARLARSAGSDFGLSLDPYLFTIGVTALEGVSLDRIEAQVEAELARLRDEPVPEAELARAKKQVRAQYVYSAEGVTNQAFWLGQMEIVDSYLRAEEIPTEIDAVTAEDVRRVAQTYFGTQSRTVGWLVPSDDGGGNGADPTVAVDAACAPRVWGLSGAMAAPGSTDAGIFERVVLDNGAVVLGQARPDEASVSVRIRIEAGAINDPDDLGGLASITARMLTRGTLQRTSAELNELTDSLGATISADAGRHAAELSMRCLTEDLPRMLGLAKEILTEPAFAEDELAKVRDQILTAIREADNDTRASADRIMRRAVFPPPHPLGRRVVGEAESIAAIDTDDLRRVHRARYAPNRTTIAAVGGASSFASLVERIEAAFGGWRGEAPPQPEPPPAPRLDSGVRVETAIPGKSQADVAVGFPTVSRLDPAYYALDVGNLILGRLGLMGRLGATVRDRRGLAYYVFSQIEPAREGSLWAARAGVDPANVERAVEAIASELRQLGAGGVSAEELADATSYLIGVLPLALETNDGVAGTLLTIEYFDLGLDYVQRYPDIIRSIGAADVLDAAGRLLDADRLVVGIARPEEPA